MTQPDPTPRKKARRTVAWIAVAVSLPVWLAAFAVPFLPLEPGPKVAVAAACIAAGEVLFWAGAAVLGSDVIAWLRVWKRKG